MITIPTDPNLDMLPFLEAFGVAATYIAPLGTKRSVRVVYLAPYVPLDFGDRVIVQSETPTAIGSAADFFDVRESGATPQLIIDGTTFQIIESQGGVTGEVVMHLSEYGHGSLPGD